MGRVIFSAFFVVAQIFREPKCFAIDWSVFVSGETNLAEVSLLDDFHLFVYWKFAFRSIMILSTNVALRRWLAGLDFLLVLMVFCCVKQLFALISWLRGECK